MEHPNTDRTLEIMVEMGREAKQLGELIREKERDRFSCGFESLKVEVTVRLDVLSMLSVKLGLCAHQQAFLDLL